MKTAIVCASKHHGSTLKLAQAIAGAEDVALIDAAKAGEVNLEPYDRIGFASGIAFGKFYREILDLMTRTLPRGRQVFFLYTCARDDKDFSLAARKIAEEKGCRVLGKYGCRGFNTFGPLKLVGGINKGCPTPEEIEGAVRFYRALQE